MKYNRIETLSHIVSTSHESCLKDFNNLIFNEDNSLSSIPNFFTDTIVLDLDCVEINIARSQSRNRFRSMDCCFAISNEKNVKMLIVELRFNYKNLANLRGRVLREKVSHSNSILGSSKDINQEYIFVFNENLVQQAKNLLQRMHPRIPNNYIAMGLTSLKSKYF